MGRDADAVVGTACDTDWELEPVTKPDIKLTMAEVAALYRDQWQSQREALDMEAA